MSRHFRALSLGGLIILIYFFQLIFPAITDHLVFIASDVLHRPWSIVTSIFIHSPSDYMHLLNNMFFLLVFGTILEQYIGSRDLLIVFFSTGIIANLAAFSFYPTTPTLGASGAVSGIIAALAVIRPNKIGIFWGAPLPMWLVLIGWIITNLAGIGADVGIAYEAHLYGLLAGAIIGAAYRQRRDTDQNDTETTVSIDNDRIREWEEQYMEN